MVARLTQLRTYLATLGIRPRKSLSQNFLIDSNIIAKLIKEANIEPGDFVLEIGPGAGAITEALLAKGAHVLAVEKDPKLAASLARLQTADHRLDIHCNDLLDFPLEKHLPAGKKTKVVANLPYHIASPILALLTPLHNLISQITVIVQKEVAVRYVAKPNTSDYSSISVYLQFFSAPRLLFTISKSCFYPPPKIESATIQLTLKTPPLTPWEPYFELVRSAFNQKRKMLRASLKEKYPNIRKALQEIDKPGTTRPQELSYEEYLALYHLLSQRQ